MNSPKTSSSSNRSTLGEEIVDFTDPKEWTSRAKTIITQHLKMMEELTQQKNDPSLSLILDLLHVIDSYSVIDPETKVGKKIGGHSKNSYGKIEYYHRVLA